MTFDEAFVGANRNIFCEAAAVPWFCPIQIAQSSHTLISTNISVLQIIDMAFKFDTRYQVIHGRQICLRSWVIFVIDL